MKCELCVPGTVPESFPFLENAPFHVLCFIRWPGRRDYVRAFNDAHRADGPRRPVMDFLGDVRDGDAIDVLDAECGSQWMILDERWVRAGTPDLERMMSDEPFRQAWLDLTRPLNIPVLERRLSMDINPLARAWTERALADARRRA